MKKKLRSQSSAEDEEQRYRTVFEAATDGIIISDLETGRVVDANPASIAMHGYTREEFIGLHLTGYIHPDSQPRFTESANDAERGGTFDGPTIHLRKDGSPIQVEVRRSAITYQGRPCLLSVIRDVGQRIQTEQALSAQIDARMREQATLLAISHTLASTLELQPGLILDQLREIIGYNRAGLFSLEDNDLITLATRGAQQLEQAEPIRIHLTSPEDLTALFNEHRPIRIADVQRGNPQAKFLWSLLADGAAVLLEGMRSWMWVPLAVRGRIIGGVGVAHEKRNYFTAHHADLALSMANQAAITMINAELNEDAKALAVLEERQRLARNLHDAVNQSLFSAGLIAEVLPRLWDRDQLLARQSLEDLRMLTRGAMAEMRALLAELRPSTLTDADLGDLLRLLANAFTGRTNIPANMTIVEHGGLPAEVQVATYRICQEALNNIGKHAGASRVDIDLKHQDGSLELSIRDDGKGFDPERTNSGHYGLSMMQERAEAVGALLAITSQPGDGTELTIRWKNTPTQETS